MYEKLFLMENERNLIVDLGVTRMTDMVPLSQNEHRLYNSTHYPGTRQLCVCCDQPTDRCEEDGIYIENGDQYIGPLCMQCYDEMK